MNASEVVDFRRSVPVRHSVDVFVAGRCVSTDQAVQSSIRTMPGCFLTGQAAGMAAALAVDAQIDGQSADVHMVSVPELQRRLRKMGAYLPNASL